MCISPSYVWVERGPKYEKQIVPCRKCWRCRSNRVNDYVGRCLCEAETSVKTIALTLTYAPRDDLAEKEINSRHFQLFIKLLRRAGHKVRYLVVGEYGELRGRVHFHAILFFQQSKTPPPEYPNKENFKLKEWPHGHAFCDNDGDEKAVRYTCKYVLKNEPGTYWMSVSKNPALGWEYFKKKAHKGAELDVMPNSFSYMPPNGTRGRPYMLRGAVRRDYLALIVNLLELKRVIKRLSMNEWVIKAYDKMKKWEWERRIAANPVPDAEFMERMSEDLDKQRISQTSANAVVYHSYWSQHLGLDDEQNERNLEQWQNDLALVQTHLDNPDNPAPLARELSNLYAKGLDGALLARIKRSLEPPPIPFQMSST